jgi:hypothetical protein
MITMRSLITVVLAMTIAIGCTATLASSAARQTGNSYPSGGLGLSLDDFEARYGPGEVGQTYMQYQLPDGMYFVGATKSQSQGQRTINYIERSWDEGSGGSLDDAKAEAGSLLPADAKFIESYQATSARILHGTRVDRYQSRTISQRLKDDEHRYGSNIVIIYHLVPATDAYDVMVERFMIVPAEK